MLVNSGGPRENACKSTGMPAGRCRPMGPSSISQQRDATSAMSSGWAGGASWDCKRSPMDAKSPRPHLPPMGPMGPWGRQGCRGTRSRGWAVSQGHLFAVPSVSSTTNIPAVSTNSWRRNTLNLAAWLQQRNVKPRDFHHSFSTKPLCSPTYAPLRHPPAGLSNVLQLPVPEQPL